MNFHTYIYEEVKKICMHVCILVCDKYIDVDKCIHLQKIKEPRKGTTLNVGNKDRIVTAYGLKGIKKGVETYCQKQQM